MHGQRRREPGPHDRGRTRKALPRPRLTSRSQDGPAPSKEPGHGRSARDPGPQRSIHPGAPVLVAVIWATPRSPAWRTTGRRTRFRRTRCGARSPTTTWGSAPRRPPPGPAAAARPGRARPGGDCLGRSRWFPHPRAPGRCRGRPLGPEAASRPAGLRRRPGSAGARSPRPKGEPDRDREHLHRRRGCPDPGGDVLLIERGRPPFQGAWALPGGHVDAGESPFVAAAREPAEETGVHVPVGNLHQIGVWDQVAATRAARTSPSRTWSSASTAAGHRRGRRRTARWWPVKDLPERLAFDHSDIISAAVAPNS
ncbi:NUDIX domain-containing protein [Streptomyces sp. NPDC054932]